MVGIEIRQFRSEKPTGPYVDVAGNTLQDQDDSFQLWVLKMMGNYTFPSFKLYLYGTGRSVHISG